MKVQVLKAFPYAHDGARARQLDVGEQVEIHDDLVPGLAAEGYVGEADGRPADADEVEIPDDWDKLHWFKQRALAAKISGAAVADKVSAVAIIEAELARREAA